VVGDHLAAQQHDDAFGMGAHQHHPAGGPRINAVAIMIGHDQASGAGPDGLLDEPIERAAQLHQTRAFFLEHLPDRPVLELRVLGPLCVGDALIFQPRIQFGEALHPRLGPEHLVAQIADLVLDLTLLPSRSGRAAPQPTGRKVISTEARATTAGLILWYDSRIPQEAGPVIIEELFCGRISPEY